MLCQPHAPHSWRQQGQRGSCRQRHQGRKQRMGIRQFMPGCKHLLGARVTSLSALYGRNFWSKYGNKAVLLCTLLLCGFFPEGIRQIVFSPPIQGDDTQVHHSQWRGCEIQREFIQVCTAQQYVQCRVP